MNATPPPRREDSSFIGTRGGGSFGSSNRVHLQSPAITCFYLVPNLFTFCSLKICWCRTRMADHCESVRRTQSPRHQFQVLNHSNVHGHQKTWGILLTCCKLNWGLWWERNACTFEGCEKSTHDLKLFFLQTLLGWTNALGVFTFNSLMDLLDSCTFFAL